jgi:hypothetical protein
LIRGKLSKSLVFAGLSAEALAEADEGEAIKLYHKNTLFIIALPLINHKM